MASKVDEPDVAPITQHSGRQGPPRAIQEWTGDSWKVVQVLDSPGDHAPKPLDAKAFPGEYVGQRVVTA